jgi:DNA-binding GntR family transcriptional regulator
VNKQERVYAALRERILGGVYGPGYRLVIDRIADEFGMSALPVREAIRRLEAGGLVMFRPNAGAQVTPAYPGQYAESMTVLAVLEGYATAQAAPHMTPADLDELEAATEEMLSAMQRLDVAGFSEANRRFHHLIHLRCGNPSLQRELLETERRLEAIRKTAFSGAPVRGLPSIEENRELVALMRANASPEQLEQTAREHTLRGVAAFREWEAVSVGAGS